MKAKNHEKRTADTILQRPDTIEVAGKVYDVAPVTIATLIMVSEEVAKLPQKEVAEETNVIEHVLKNARDYKGIGRIAAIMMVGAKEAMKERRLLGSMNNNKVESLAKELVDECSPTQMLNLISRLLKRMEVDSFFALSTFLGGINTIAPTREVENETIARGH